MTTIHNALVRVEGAARPLRAPFENAGAQPDLWVREIPLGAKAGVREFCVAAHAALEEIEPELLQLRAEGCVLTLFLEAEDAEGECLALDAGLISLAGRLGLRLEIFLPEE